MRETVKDAKTLSWAGRCYSRRIMAGGVAQTVASFNDEESPGTTGQGAGQRPAGAIVPQK